MENATASKWKELAPRVLYGTIAATVTLFCVIYSPLSFYALLLFGALLMYGEWMELTKPFSLLNRLGGIVYVGIPVWSLIALRDTASFTYVLHLFSIVWATDIGAYFGGKQFGKHALAPRISPSKTVEGLGAGVLVALICGGLGSLYLNITPQEGLLLGAALALVSQAGDLFESWLKRQAGVKDSGTLLPGHGGILDRVDGLVFAAPVYTAYMLF